MAIVYHKKVLAHMQWEGHPESPFRAKTLKKKLMQEGLWNDVVPPVMIRDDDVLKVHTAELLNRLRGGGHIPLDPDTLLKDETYGLAMLSASVATTAVKLAMGGVPSFAVTRPPGHHAGKDFMGGFCYLNNVAIAVEAAGVRTAIVDIDVHHGNGTENVFYGRDDVLLIDMHEDNHYPYTGKKEDTGTGKGEGYTVNIPLPPGCGNNAYRIAMDEIVIPVLRKFDPELIVVSLGVDGHYCDPHSNMSLNTQGYIELCKSLIEESKNGKIAFVLEGGYHLRSTAEVAAGILASLEGKEIKPEYNEERPENSNGPRAVRKIREFFAERWNL
ncbi:MAG: histone deacetylase [Methanomassiliicoccaceae archaeon]|jgi:acetoin utilization deacetylase AcuC-like enzyme|nr:histone deacetylase [Methanomassiliicoccaceae archaeon]